MSTDNTTTSTILNNRQTTVMSRFFNFRNKKTWLIIIVGVLMAIALMVIVYFMVKSTKSTTKKEEKITTSSPPASSAVDTILPSDNSPNEPKILPGNTDTPSTSSDNSISKNPVSGTNSNVNTPLTRYVGETVKVKYNSSSGEETDVDKKTKRRYRRAAPVYEQPGINTITLSDEDMRTSKKIGIEKTLIMNLRKKIIKFDNPETYANFRFYGELSPTGHIYFFNNRGICVSDIQINDQNVVSNISGIVKEITMQIGKYLHFIIDNYKVYLNTIYIGELNLQHNLQYIRIDDDKQQLKEIQLIDEDPSEVINEINKKSIFG